MTFFGRSLFLARAMTVENELENGKVFFNVNENAVEVTFTFHLAVCYLEMDFSLQPTPSSRATCHKE